MHKILKKFLNENRENKELYYKAVIMKNKEALQELEERFNNYIFRIYLFSYISKSIKFTSYKIKIQRKKIKDKEKMTLNIIDEDYQEERINTIEDTSIDFLEPIKNPNGTIDFNAVVQNKKILKEINKLTNRQKEILYDCIILDLDEKTVANNLKISIQSVNKTKNAAIKNIKRAIGA
ncbi:hypothetical protein [Caldisalinibacter kiritimatiensis]|uniref:RNA polymerase sigma factor 70 region 4 type 2 domain-containing protein n=1 Tax=Caldisalinibacter kiritimatiensis TaxID=1304284 RepID=R1AW61_9FIRM|nr:hypothetical protein [Caldisalinibacter kiritimatiensis]EOD01408.1 hypothetical protein L21TH_0523 [Caldisalinibacter kiritimatiensis]